MLARQAAARDRRLQGAPSVLAHVPSAMARVACGGALAGPGGGRDGGREEEREKERDYDRAEAERAESGRLLGGRLHAVQFVRPAGAREPTPRCSDECPNCRRL